MASCRKPVMCCIAQVSEPGRQSPQRSVPPLHFRPGAHRVRQSRYSLLRFEDGTISCCREILLGNNELSGEIRADSIFVKDKILVCVCHHSANVIAIGYIMPYACSRLCLENNRLSGLIPGGLGLQRRLRCVFVDVFACSIHL